MVHIQLKGGIAALLLLLVGIVLAALALAAGLAFLLPFAVLAVLAATLRALSRRLSRGRRVPGRGDPGRPPAAEQIIEIDVVEPSARELEAGKDR